MGNNYYLARNETNRRKMIMLKMKYLQLLFTIVFFSATSIISSEAAVKKVIRLSDTPSSLDVSIALNVRIIPSNKNEIHVLDDPSGCFDYSEKRGKLVLTRDDGKYSSENFVNIDLYLKKVDNLEKIQLSSVSSVDISGKIRLKKLLADLVGASRLSIDAEVDDFRLLVSGASSVSVNSKIRKLSMDISGASKIDVNSDFSDLKLFLSGASNVKIEGRGNSAILDVSGVSFFNGKRCYVQDAWLECSGMSKITIHAKVIRQESVSGMSSIRVLK